jgi:hypothetical protein
MSKPLPDAYLLLAPGCAHCPTVLEGLSQLVKNGQLGRLEVVNIAAHPEAAHQVGTRSVPWCRIGPFELDGAQTPAELAVWTEHARQGTGLDRYFSHLLETRRPHAVAHVIAQNAPAISELLGLLENAETPMSVRIGVGVVLEDLQGNPILQQGLETLQRLAQAAEANIRADAAHYLGMLENEQARRLLTGLLQDEHPDVREIAAESLAQLNGTA